MFANPIRLIEQFDLTNGQVVADLGAGTGALSFEAAKAVAPDGRVYAVDVHKDLMSRLKNEAVHNHFGSIEVIVGDFEKLGGTRIREASIDRAIFSNVLFMTENKKSAVQELSRIIKRGGLVMVVDWAGSFGGMGPQPDHVFYKDDAVKLFLSSGFSQYKEIDAGDRHYGIIFRKN